MIHDLLMIAFGIAIPTCIGGIVKIAFFVANIVTRMRHR